HPFWRRLAAGLFAGWEDARVRRLAGREPTFVGSVYGQKAAKSATPERVEVAGVHARWPHPDLGRERLRHPLLGSADRRTAAAAGRPRRHGQRHRPVTGWFVTRFRVER